MRIHRFDHFTSRKDPRVERTKLHALMDIVAVTICGVLCGADGWDDIHFYACSLESWYRTFLPLTHGIPSSDTMRRVMSAIHPDQFHACLLSWVQSIAHHKTRAEHVRGRAAGFLVCSYSYEIGRASCRERV